jgi:hypothetical protein
VERQRRGLGHTPEWSESSLEQLLHTVKESSQFLPRDCAGYLSPENGDSSFMYFLGPHEQSLGDPGVGGQTLLTFTGKTLVGTQSKDTVGPEGHQETLRYLSVLHSGHGRLACSK